MNVRATQHRFSLKQRIVVWFCFALKWGSVLFGLMFAVMLAIDLGTSYMVRDRIYTKLTELPYREHTMVLGTAKFYLSGSPNLYYKHRLQAAKYLYAANKSRYLLVSGDNKTPYYNEPKMMTADLVKMGIPKANLKQDYAGYNTLDSVVRASKVFGIEPFTIISQQFHCERALFIAKVKGIDAICYTAEYPAAHYKVRIREFFARTGMALYLLFGVEPTSLESSKINELPQRKVTSSF